MPRDSDFDTRLTSQERGKAVRLAVHATDVYIYKWPLAYPPPHLAHVKFVERIGQTANHMGQKKDAVLCNRRRLYLQCRGDSIMDRLLADPQVGEKCFGTLESIEVISEKSVPAVQGWGMSVSELPRVKAHSRADACEEKHIAAKGLWRGVNAANPQEQRLNEKVGGQGDEWARIQSSVLHERYAVASHCEHGRVRSKCKECGGSSIPPQLPQPPSPLFRPGFLAQPGLPLASGFPCASAIFPPLGLFGTPLGTCTHQPTTATAHNEPAQQGHPPTPPPTTALTPKRKAPMSASELHCHGYT